jgi:hypothetical protein
MINFRPGEGTKTIYGVGGARFVKDTYVPPFNPPQPAPVEEVVEEIKTEENELQRTQVEQTEISSGSENTRESSTGDKQDPSRKPRV